MENEGLRKEIKARKGKPTDKALEVENTLLKEINNDLHARIDELENEIIDLVQQREELEGLAAGSADSKATPIDGNPMFPAHPTLPSLRPAGPSDDTSAISND